MPAEIQPFHIHAADGDLDDLKHRLRATRWPEPETVKDWSQGVPLAYLRQVCDYWTNTYNWRTREAGLNAFPQFRMEIDSVGIHFLHVRSPHAAATPLILTHGWPGS